MLFPGGVVEIGVPLVPLVAQKKVLLCQFYVNVHHKKVAVLFPLDFVFYEGKGVKGVAEIGLERFFKPVDVLHGIVWVLVVMKVEEAVILFLVGNKVCVRPESRH